VQIIIVQAEIEEAIRNHILSQIHVREGMDINIDLAATRGAAGFTATINIIPSSNKGSNPFVAVALVTYKEPTSLVEVPEPAQAGPVRIVGATREEREAIMEQLSKEDEASQADTGGTEQPVEQAATPVMALDQDAANPQPASEETATGGTGDRRGLFRSLKKPTNS
jgi:hypothetical protein